MTIEIDPSELGAYTNNLPNKEGIKKLLKKIEEGGSFDPTEYYDKEATDELLETKQDVLTSGNNIILSQSMKYPLKEAMKNIYQSPLFPREGRTRSCKSPNTISSASK